MVLVMKGDISEELARSLRESYDQLAEEYAHRLFHELEQKPLDRKLLDRFAIEVPKNGEVCDLGCGPGHVARYLRSRGVSVFGLDVSPKMVEVARKLNPAISFRQGDALSLELADASLTGIVAFYLICNIPKDLLTQTFREMKRVLKPGGLLLVSFHNGDDEVIHEVERWGMRISLDSFLCRPLTVRGSLEEVGFQVSDVIERDPYDPSVEYQSRRTYIFAQK